jgi:hypothetical protein
MASHKVASSEMVPGIPHSPDRIPESIAKTAGEVPHHYFYCDQFFGQDRKIAAKIVDEVMYHCYRRDNIDCYH